MPGNTRSPFPHCCSAYAERRSRRNKIKMFHTPRARPLRYVYFRLRSLAKQRPCRSRHSLGSFAAGQQPHLAPICVGSGASMSVITVTFKSAQHGAPALFRALLCRRPPFSPSSSRSPSRSPFRSTKQISPHSRLFKHIRQPSRSARRRA